MEKIFQEGETVVTNFKGRPHQFEFTVEFSLVRVVGYYQVTGGLISSAIPCFFDNKNLLPVN